MVVLFRVLRPILERYLEVSYLESPRFHYVYVNECRLGPIPVVAIFQTQSLCSHRTCQLSVDMMKRARLLTIVVVIAITRARI